MLNTITIAGRMVRDPELRRTNSGKAATSFTLAVDRDFKNQQTGEKEVDFLDCTAFGAAGENAAKYFRKGQMAIVTGRLQIRVSVSCGICRTMEASPRPRRLPSTAVTGWVLESGT